MKPKKRAAYSTREKEASSKCKTSIFKLQPREEILETTEKGEALLVTAIASSNEQEDTCVFSFNTNGIKNSIDESLTYLSTYLNIPLER